MTDVLVYSAMFGEYDEIREPLEPGRYRLITDGRAPWPWEEQHEPPTYSPQRTARWWKTAGMPHDYPFTVWLDSNIQLAIEPDELVDAWLVKPKADIALFHHPVRDCAYMEAQVVKSKRKDLPQIVDEQMARYKAKGFPAHFGLGETPVVVRRNTPAVRKFNELWWKEIRQGSVRDQLSFDYVRWLAGTLVKVNFIDGGHAWRRREHPWLKAWRHRGQ